MSAGVLLVQVVSLNRQGHGTYNDFLVNSCAVLCEKPHLSGIINYYYYIGNLTCNMESLADTFWLSLRLFRLSFSSITQPLVQLSMSSLILRTSSHSAKLWFRRSMLSSIFSDT